MAERPAAVAQRRPSQHNADEPAIYSAVVERHQEVGDHVEYCLRVTHRSGLRWRSWRRFSAFQQLHADLSAALGSEAQRRRLPSAPQKSWLPSFTQALAGDFCEQRQREVQAYLDAVLGDQALSRLPPVQTVLGVQPPEPPAGLRVVPRCGGHELEVRPACIAAADCEEPTPVDGYQIEILHCESGTRHPITREVGCSGLQLQKAQIGQLPAGQHQFAVSAFNLAGQSGAVSILVDTALLLPLPSEAPQEERRRAVSRGAPADAGAETPVAAPAPQPPLAASGAAVGSRPVSNSRAARLGAGSAAHGASQPALGEARGGRPLAQQAPAATRPAGLAAALSSPSWQPGPGTSQRPRHLQAAPPAPTPAPAPPVAPVAPASPPAQAPTPGQLRGWGEPAGAAQLHHSGVSPVLASAITGPERALQQAARAMRPDVGASPSLRAPRLGAADPSQRPGQAELPWPPAAGPQPRQPAPRAGARPVGPSGPSGPRVEEALRGAPPQQPEAGRSRPPHYLARAPPPAEQGHFDPAPRQRWATRQREALAPAPVPAAPREALAAAGLGARGEPEEALDDEQLCVVCLAEPKTHAFVPCGHRCVCIRCGNDMLKGPKASCPICRREASHLLQIFV